MQHRISKDVDGQTYIIAHYPPSRALSILTRLLNLAGVGLEKAGAGGLDTDIGEAILPALGGLLQRLDDAQVKRLVDDLLSSCYAADNQAVPIQMDAYRGFMGRPGHMIKVCAAVIEVQFADFWEAARARLSAAGLAASKGQASSGVVPLTG